MEKKIGIKGEDTEVQIGTIESSHNEGYLLEVESSLNHNSNNSIQVI